MMNRHWHTCKVAATCEFGSSRSGDSHCDYIGKTGRSRVNAGYVIDREKGRCGAYTEIKTKRKGSMYSIKRG